MRPIVISKTLTALDRDAVATAQQLLAAGDLVLDGAATSGGVATFTTQRVVGIYSAGDLSAITFTVYGTDEQGFSISQAIAGPNNSTVSTTLNFYTVTRVAANAAVGSDVEVGYTGVGATAPIPLDQYISPFSVTLALEFAGTSNATVQYTNDDVFASNSHDAGVITWTNISALASKTSYTDTALTAPVSAVRLLINSGTDATRLIVRQAGIR